MIGFVLGGLMTLAILKLARRHRACGHHGYGPGYAYLDGGPWGGGPGHHRRWPGRWQMWHHLSDRLQTTPGQERTMAAAWEEFRAEVGSLKEEGARTRADLASALRKETFDEVLMGELYARHDSALEKARKAFVGLFAKVHDTLEPEQRERLAVAVERGPRAFWSPGPFFGW